MKKIRKVEIVVYDEEGNKNILAEGVAIAAIVLEKDEAVAEGGFGLAGRIPGEDLIQMKWFFDYHIEKEIKNSISSEMEQNQGETFNLEDLDIMDFLKDIHSE